MASITVGGGLLAVGMVSRFAIRVCELLFAAGMLGSAAVVVISFIEDLKEAFAKDKLHT